MRDNPESSGAPDQPPTAGPMGASQTDRRRSALLLAGMIVAAAIGLARVSGPITDNDVWLHMAVGRWVVEHKAVPHSDVFSCTIHGKPWVPHEWLAAVALYGTERAGGLAAVRALNAALFIAFAAAVGWWVWRLFPRRVLLPLLLFCCALAFADIRFNWRPEIFTIPLLVVLAGRVLMRLPDDPPSWRECAAWWGVTVLWANLHGMVFLGVGLVGVYAGGVWLLAFFRPRSAGAIPDGRALRRWTALLLGMLAAAFVVPEGWALLSHAWDIFARSRSADYPIREWTPGVKVLAGWFAHVLDLLTLSVAPQADDVFRALLVAVMAALPVLGCVALARRRYEEVPRLAVAAACIVLALYAVRLFWLALIPAVGAAVLWRNLYADAPSSAGVALARGRGGRLALCGLVIAVLAASAVGIRDRRGNGTNDLDEGLFPVGMARFLRAAGYEGNLYNPYRWGGYFLFALDARARVFIDGRNDAFMRVAPEVFEDYYQVQTAQSAAPGILRKYGVDVAALAWPRGALFPVRVGALGERLGDFVPALVNQEGMLFVRVVATPDHGPAFARCARFWAERGVAFSPERGVSVEDVAQHREVALELKMLPADHWREADLAADTARPPELRAEAAVNAANDLLALGAPDRAGNLLKLALGLDRSNTDAMAGLARVAWLYGGRDDEALRWADEVSRAAPRDPLGRQMREYILRHSNPGATVDAKAAK